MKPVRDARSLKRTITIRAPEARVARAFTTLAGVRGWWTPLVSGTPRKGGTLRLRFEGLDEEIVFRVTASAIASASAAVP